MEQIKRTINNHYWVIVIGCFFITFAGIGVAINCNSLFIKPVLASQAFSRADFSLTFTIQAMSMMIASPFVGKILDKYPMRLVMTLSSIIASICLMMYSCCNSLIQFYTCSVFFGLSLSGFSLISASMIITNWFKEKQGLAIGIAMTGAGAGGMLFNPVANWLIITYGWRAAYLALGCIFAAISIPVSIFLVRRHPSEMGLLPYGESSEETVDSVCVNPGLTLPQALKTSSFWLLALVIFSASMITQGTIMHIPAYMTDIGFSSKFAASIISLLLGIAIAGKLLTGIILDRFGMKTGTVCICLILFAALLTLFEVRSMWLVIIFGILFGMSYPIMSVVPPFLTAGIFGKKDYGVIWGVMFFFSNLGSGLGIPFSGFIYDTQGSYFMAWVIYAGLALLCIPMAILAISKGKASMERFNPLEPEEKQSEVNCMNMGKHNA